MAQGRSLRASASLAIALALVAATSAGAIAAPRGSAGVNASTSHTAEPGATHTRKLAASQRTVQSRGSVNVKRLAAKKPTKRPTAQLPHLGKPGTMSGGTTTGGGTKTPKVAAALGPPAPTDATTNSDGAASATSFAGLAQSTDTFTAVEPPDPWVAVGPEHVVQAVNLEFRMTDRQGTDKQVVSMADLFDLPPFDPMDSTSYPFFNSDPHVIYDSLHGRWLATEVSWDCAGTGDITDIIDPVWGTGYIDTAVSRTSDPTGVWDVGFISFQDQLPDYPAPGTSTDKIAFASNLYDMTQSDSGANDGSCVANATYNAGDILVADWTDVLNGGGFDLLEDHQETWFTPRIAVQEPATSAKLQGIAIDDLGTGATNARYFTLTGSVATSVVYEADYDLTASDIVTGFADPPPPIQPGGTITEAVDLRPTDAIWQGNRLVYVSTYPCSGRDCVRVTELNTAAVTNLIPPTLTQDFLIKTSGKDDFMGGVGLTGNGTLHVGWTRSSASGGDFPSSYTAHQSVGATAGSLSAEAQIGVGTGNYTGTRWGDYVGIAQDPQVPNQAWDGNQYSGGGSGWKTKITALQTQGTTYVPITPVRVLDTRTTTGGLQGGFTTNNPRSWQVSGVGGIPAGAVAVTGNVTATGQTSAGFVAVTVTSTSTPPSSTINFPATGTRANNVTIPLTAGGRLSAVYKTSASGKKTQLLFDVTGYFLADSTAATYTPLTAPVRALDTRVNTGLTGVFHANQNRTLVIGGAPLLGVPITATAITGNLTIVSPTVAGFASVTKDPTNAPSTSTINFPAKSVRANGIFAPLDVDHALSIVYRTSGSGSTNVLLDITGYFDPTPGGLLFVPMTPSRILDSRTSSVLSGIHGKFVASTPRALAVQGHWGVPSTAQAVTGNLTVTGQTAAGYVSATPTSIANPTTSTINFPVGDTMANGLLAPLNGSGESFFVYGSSAGKTVDLILDLSGYFEP